VETHQQAKFRQNRSIGCKLLRFFDFSRWRPSPSWIFEIVNFYFLAVSGGLRRITVPYFVKIGRSIAEILQFIEFSSWPPPPFWIFQIAKFYWLLGSRRSRRISMPNFVKIGQSVAKTLRFFDFSRWRPSPSWIFEIVNFYLLSVSGKLSRITLSKFCQNRSLCCGDIAIFRTFKMAAAAILDFWNCEILLAIGSSRSRCISMPNFVKIGQSVAKILRFFDFQDGSRPPSWIRLRHIWTTHSEYLWVSITVQNLVMIDAVVFIIWTFQFLARLAGKCLFTPPKLGFLGNLIP